MFFFRHPKPVVDGRAVAVQVVQRKETQAASRTVLIVETPPAPAPAPPPAAEAHADAAGGAGDDDAPRRTARR